MERSIDVNHLSNMRHVDFEHVANLVLCLSLGEFRDLLQLGNFHTVK